MTVAYQFQPLYHTPSSSQWTILGDDDTRLGRVDLHFEPGRARVTLVLVEAIDDDGLEALAALVDEQLVPALSRGDVRISAWRGTLLGTFAPA